MSVVPGFEWLQPVLGLNSVKWGGGRENICNFATTGWEECVIICYEKIYD